MSTEEYFRDLMNAEIDGVITAEEAGELAERLRADPEASAYYEELRRTVRLLDGAGKVSPPADLRERILDAVRADRAGDATRAASPHRSRSSTPGGRSWRRGGYIPAFAAGVAAGLLIFAAVAYRGDEPVAPGSSGGTIGLDPAPRSFVREWTAEFAGAGVEGTVTAVFDSTGTTVLLRIGAETETTALLEYGAGFEFEGISSPDGAPFQMEVERGNVLIVHDGAGEYRIRLRGAASGPVDLKIFAEGTIIARIPIERKK